MNTVQKLWFHHCFTAHFADKKGSAFQDFFSDIMEAAYRGDFTRVCPWGKQGDLKCDGFLSSVPSIFQVYAPRELSEASTILKMNEDLEGAKKHWPGQFKRWVFVHNDRDGLPPGILKHVRALKSGHAGALDIETWGYPELGMAVRQLAFDDAVQLFGLGPEPSEYVVIGFADVASLLDHFRTLQPQRGPGDILPVPAHKLDRNGLSQDVRDFLMLGMRYAQVVSDFFAQATDPELGERVAAAFRARYVELRAAGLPPDEVFSGLQDFAGGSERGDTRRQSAVLAVLAYLFDRCDIFERPDEAVA